MPNVTIEKQFYPNFGETLKLSNGLVEAVVSLEFGPRILSFGFPGGKNFLYEDPQKHPGVSGDALEAVFGRGSKWYSYGGHRMWVSPEDMPLTYYPDNERVVYNEIPGGVELIPPPQRVTDLQFRMELFLPADKPRLTVKHSITNIGDTAKRSAAWAVTVLSKGGLELIPQPIHDTGLLANRILSLWPYSDMSDDRIYWGKKYMTLSQNQSVKSAFKFGINNVRGWAAYFNHGGLFVKRYTHRNTGIYPDNGVSFETYTNAEVLEMETLGELVNLTPGSTMFHAEEWSLFDHVERPAPNDEITADAIVKLYIEK